MYKYIDKWASWTAGFLLFCLMLLTFLDVAGRNLINRPVSGTSELTELMLAAIIFLMLPRVAIAGQHIVIDLVDTMVPKAAVAWMDAFAAWLGVVMFGLISWQVFVMAGKAMGYEDKTPTLHIPLGPILYCMSGFAALVTIAFAYAMVNAMRGVTVTVAADGPTHEIAEHGAI
jgi:TRAP-type C4-dicarboxylate transport system permease small subunit